VVGFDYWLRLLEGDTHHSESGHYRCRAGQVYRHAAPSKFGCAAQYRSAAIVDGVPLRLAVDHNNLHLLNEITGVT
jgi:hypothetical protein